MATCKACGDPVESMDVRQTRLAMTGQQIQPEEWHYCGECADELFRDHVRVSRAKLDSSSPGCPLEPNDDDSSPWQDNAIKEMEK